MRTSPEQEPVAWMSEETGDVNKSRKYFKLVEKYQNETIVPLYTPPPKREPLSDETIAELWGEEHSGKTLMVRNFARLIEKAHGIGGGE